MSEDPQKGFPEDFNLDEYKKELPNLTERARFHSLLALNPNYFGNLEKSEFENVLQIQANSFYEELGCVGFQPQFDRLEAVVYVKQLFGYGGGICTNGSREYVRFYIDCGNGWEDLGATGFAAYDIVDPERGTDRLEYDVTLRVDFSDKEKFCFVEKICKVRAILSWNVVPPPNQPNWVPVWGDRHDTFIQLEPRTFFIIQNLLDEVDLQLSDKLKPIVNLKEPIPVAKKEALEFRQLKEQLSKYKIEPHRLFLQKLQIPEAEQKSASSFQLDPQIAGIIKELDISIDDLLGQLFPTDGNTSYEEMECIGYNPRLDTLAAVIRVKRPVGYLGGLCKQGSREYVTFWADLNNNGIYETCLGTTSVNVHDIASMPREGLEYAVFLRAGLRKYMQPCYEGPKLIRIRAIMSWQVPPPCNNPNYVPVWGNREETLIHIRKGISSQPGVYVPILQTVGSMDTDDISTVTGLANGPAVLAGFTANQSPFGGSLTLTGHISNPPDISSGAAPIKYRIEVSDDNFVSTSYVTDNFDLHIDQFAGGVWSSLPPINQTVDGDSYFTYREDLTGNFFNPEFHPVGNVLGYWDTGGKTGLWKIRIRGKNTATNQEWISNTVTVRLDNTAPVADIAITSGGGDCADFTIGDVISGTYTATDVHFSSLHLSVQPALINGSPSGGSFTSPAPIPGPGTMPLRRYYPGVPTTGESGTWSLDTSTMGRCGYTIHIGVYDRTIVNSGYVGRYNSASVGLCLREPEA